jgi:type III pantothenate kinase
MRTILLFDIGNTNTHLGLASERKILRQTNIPTASWKSGKAAGLLKQFCGSAKISGACICSVVPRATPLAVKETAKIWGIKCLILTANSLRGVGVDYPKPGTIGPDRLANALAVKTRFGAPAVVVDFGTAVTFDVVDPSGNYAGGIIAPGLAAMTEYLHEKTALLPRITVRETRAVIGKSTEEAMLIGAVKGYRGLIRGLIGELKTEMASPHLPVIATGGYAKLMAAKLPEITAVDPLLTLEGLRLFWFSQPGRTVSKNSSSNRYVWSGRTIPSAMTWPSQ